MCFKRLYTNRLANSFPALGYLRSSCRLPFSQHPFLSLAMSQTIPSTENLADRKILPKQATDVQVSSRQPVSARQGTTLCISSLQLGDQVSDQKFTRQFTPIFLGCVIRMVRDSKTCSSVCCVVKRSPNHDFLGSRTESMISTLHPCYRSYQLSSY